MIEESINFRQRVELLVSQIPKGRVMTYGQLAALAGSPTAARIVGGIAHFGDPALPWHRVVNIQGGLARGYPGGRAAHAAHLEQEGVTVNQDHHVDVKKLLWQPETVDAGARNSKSQIRNQHKLLVIVGPTASGKSSLAMQIAKLCDGEIVCADSRTVYKDLDIGTAKPSKKDRDEVPHHLLDVVAPDQNFTVADFKQRAEQAIDNIQNRGKLPILVGGSGLYIDAVLFDYKFTDGNLPKDSNNTRHLHKDAPRLRSELREDAVIVGIAVDRQLLKERIADRIDEMLNAGFLNEVKFVQKNYPTSKALLAPGYKAFAEHVNGHLNLEESKALFIKNDHNLAKRQMTWFKRNQNIHWLNDQSTYIKDTLELLNKLH